MKYLKKYPLSIFIIAAVLYLSLLFRAPETPLDRVDNIDKLVHFAMYFGLCSAIWLEYLRSHARIHRTKAALFAVLLPAAMSGAIELLQSYVGRSCEAADFAANCTGVLLAVPVALWVTRPLLRRFCKPRH